MTEYLNSLQNLVQTINTLRGPDGCPWDQKQTTESLSKYIKEESDELLDSINGNIAQDICEELGDLLFTIFLCIKIEEENKRFTLSDVLSAINEKLIRRHPHVFAGYPIVDEENMRKQWLEIKRKEKN